MSKTVIVTGASKGIGAATAIAFGRAGYDVIINYHTDQKAAEAVAQQITSAGANAYLVQADVFTEAGVTALFAKAATYIDHLDVLVNNAGSPKEPELGNYTQETVLQSINNNFASAVLCSQAALPLLQAGGSMLFTSSIYGLNFGGNPGLVLYSAAKAAMINYAQTMAEKLAPTIRCNVVAPGTTLTPAWGEKKDGDYAKRSLAMTLQKEWVAAEEIAAAFVFLAETPHVNAQTIVVDGGWQKKIREE